MARVQLITAAEADASLVPTALYPEWDALVDDAIKDYHIVRASDYVANRWSCTDVDWEDETTLNDDIKEAVAKYANADLLGYLFPHNTNAEMGQGVVVEKTVKAGSVQQTTKWGDGHTGFSSNTDFLEPIDAIMDATNICVLTTGAGGSASLRRV